ncbi:hypothetical protein SOASR015_23290 [Pectobacterium carotovorum subsp. carotovorum]|nr:hypothetical protein SOASR015_23290 [Pectobacterium carotovorum subsp. carotovorum]GLX55140.1 hypothetical protein Pcaca02_04490 [Pectobacterium carotovorum subsp. carotovorum]
MSDQKTGLAENVVYVQKMKTSLTMKAANDGRNGGGPASYIPAHTSPAAAASFRT